MPATLRLLSEASEVGAPSQLKAPIRVVLADDHAMVRRALRLVLDLRLPNGCSIEMIRQLRARFPETEVVVLTMEESPLFAQHAIEAGAIGFVLKDRADTELLSAVRLAARGEGYVSPRVASGLEALHRATSGDRLSERETEIVRLIALGHTSAEIACQLHLSRRTVETHRARIHSKLGFRTRADLVQFALDRRLIGAP